ncbi:type II toxin-antitoxin system RelE/ParE family toxin [Polynucleobacter paneuropaeus]|uniref:type II toxin-antitoxin system RelE family toxin n=1 Tax=Polynucleobacter sphagniphilus TaxID=1743169 RepID=UPI001BFE13AC|nr:type II toxin-antitoxin system RelE/ParE family toxin [Polynucleobacter sphagniphilus]MBT8587069.1 type II toxin-antitoxin system RelE/ParE family toxin [Polynucleobacter paneuropaeus]MBT8599737.1 type II toxin-antitoxin system RelE/ParE family toxin [Polynucleobacter paneuropaeus]MDH6248385.1 mRNA interferase RelE/StbE [Polynucleobacter sphagniphilus]QWD32264.1 type II toxin-antitoxin system RelE/ParE family toxin [Polynucleobacter paneuropaeus]
MAWIIKYAESASKQLKKLDKQTALRVLDYMDERVAALDDPRALGKNLKGPKIGEYWRYRVGDIRVICNIVDGQMMVLVIEIGNRREVYR